MNGFHQLVTRIPYALYLRLKARADEANKSMNSLVIEAVTRLLSSESEDEERPS